MTKQQQLFEKVHELTEFCLAHAGRCFAGWSREKVFLHIGNAAMRGELFVIRKCGEVKAMATIQRTTNGVLIGGVIGTREDCQKIYRMGCKQWPDVKRFFSYRWRGSEHKLVELRSVERFCKGRVK